MSIYRSLLMLGCLFLSLIVLTSNAIAATQKTTNWLDKPISISFQNEPLSKILKQISEETGVSIAYDQELANEKVTGNYQNVKTSDAITRLFRSKNKSIQVNKAKKIIIVKTFGAKSFIWAGTIQGQSSSSQITLADLEKMHAQQYKEYKDRISNDNEILEGGDGITRGELRSKHESQYKDYRERLANDSEVIEGHMTRAGIRDMHEKQYEGYRKRLANDSEVINKKGMTQGELRKIHGEQYKTYQKRLANGNEIIEGRMTRDEIRDMHEKQYKEYRKRLQDKSRVIEL